MTQPIRLYGKEQIEDWASKRADDAGRLSRQLLYTMRENERLREALEFYAKYPENYKPKEFEMNAAIMNDSGLKARQALSNKESKND